MAAVVLALVSVQSVSAGRNREHGQRGNGAGELGTIIGGNGGGFRSRQDRLRHHPQEKFAIVKEPEQPHSEFMKGKSECCFGSVRRSADCNLIGYKSRDKCDDDPSLNTVNVYVYESTRRLPEHISSVFARGLRMHV